MNQDVEIVKEALGGVSLSQADTTGPSPSGDVADNDVSTSKSSKGQEHRKPARCRFYNTKRGCRAGSSCPYRHEAPLSEAVKKPSDIGSTSSIHDGTTASNTPGKQVIQQSTKPNPPDQRTFQVNQIKRRFQAKEEALENGGIALNFGMTPSDPDFPFDISTLECSLKVPTRFPKNSSPSLRVSNKEMERGFQINVEQGFDEIWKQASNPTLLNAMKVLDKHLEALLMAEKAETITLIANTGKVAPTIPGHTDIAINPPHSARTAVVSPAPAPAQTNINTEKPARSEISEERVAQAKAKRENETGLLEARFGREPSFSKYASNGGTVFIIPVDPPKRSALPAAIRSVEQIRLFVPFNYNLEPCTIALPRLEGDAEEAVCKAFWERAKSHPDWTLLSQLNYLVQNMHKMANQSIQGLPNSTTTNKKPQLFVQDTNSQEFTNEHPKEPEWVVDTEREHLKIIPRPPEWDAKPRREEAGDETTDGYDSEYSTFGEDEESEPNEEHETENATSSGPTPSRERGILISFPDLELHSIELLELVLINATVKCERCKDTMDIQRLKPQSEESTSATTPMTNLLSTSCKKCAAPFSLGYRKDIMHANSFRAGYLDLEGCTIVDLLPSTFIPTCADCSTPLTQGTTSVRGESTLSICRTCHRKLTFRIPEVKFLHVGGGGSKLPLKPTRKAPKETLGIVAGTPLPDRGRCRHYAKSYRWFRFSCCGKVFPCDKCHDKATDHPNEFANRMICGWCSREQHYRPEDCGFSGCRKNVTGRTGSGFWEGGKGTRDRARMSRKDPRKYKRRGGGALASKNK